MKLAEIVTQIEERGLYRTRSTHLRSTVATALKREERFEKVGHGLYRWVGGGRRPRGAR